MDVETGSGSPISPGRLHASLAWGLIDQTLSSSTNLALVVLGGRLLGPTRLGVISIGFAVYVLVLVIHRSLVIEPLIVNASSAGDTEWRAVSGRGIWASLFLGTAAAAAMGVIGSLAPGPIGRGMWLFAPWIIPALLQDYWRFWLFRESMGSSAATNDGAWAFGMAMCSLIAVTFPSDWLVVSAWGMGASAAAAVGFVQTKARLQGPRTSWRWWRAEAWPFGRWLGMDRVVASAGTQGTILVIAGLLTASDVGGFRAVQSVFAPVSLLGPAIGLPGLPAMSSALHRSRARAGLLAIRLSGLLIAMTAAYLVLVGLLKGNLLAVVFGPSFRAYEGLIYPIAVTQLLVAASMGFILLLKAARRGPALLVSDTVGAIALFFAVWLLTGTSGVVGAGWGQAIGAGVTTALIAGSCMLQKRELVEPAADPTLAGIP